MTQFGLASSEVWRALDIYILHGARRCVCTACVTSWSPPYLSQILIPFINPNIFISGSHSLSETKLTKMVFIKIMRIFLTYYEQVGNSQINISVCLQVAKMPKCNSVVICMSSYEKMIKQQLNNKAIENGPVHN